MKQTNVIWRFFRLGRSPDASAHPCILATQKSRKTSLNSSDSHAELCIKFCSALFYFIGTRSALHVPRGWRPSLSARPSAPLASSLAPGDVCSDYTHRRLNDYGAITISPFSSKSRRPSARFGDAFREIKRPSGEDGNDQTSLSAVRHSNSALGKRW